MAPSRSVSVEYTVEIYDSSFDLRFVAGDKFYECDEVFVSFREISLKAKPKKAVEAKTIKLFCKNLCVPVFDRATGTTTEYEDLAFVNLPKFTASSAREITIPINSPEYRIPISGRRIEFEATDLYDNKDAFSFEEWVEKSYVRMSVRRRNV